MNTSTLTLADQLFPQLDLGDRRRDRRLAAAVEALAERPGLSLPHVFPRTSDSNAFLRLFRADECSHENLLGAHQAAVWDTRDWWRCGAGWRCGC